MERFFKPPKLEIEISEIQISLPKNEELQREELGLKLAQLFVAKNPKLSQIKELSKEFAKNKKLNLAESNSILRYSLPEIINFKMRKI